MWQALKRANSIEVQSKCCKLARIETGDTALGVSDMEYLTPQWIGWVEFKVLETTKESSFFTFGSDFTQAQCLWLLDHHYLSRYRCSWLLVGCPYRSRAGWERWILLPAPVTVRLLKSLRVTLGAVLQWPETIVAKTALGVLQQLGQGIQGNANTRTG